jgi:3',5'-cyclic AMP phosphodiesterase CpdA
VTRPASTALRIAHVSDIHVGAHDDLALDGLAADLHAADVAATVVTGDLTMRARSHQFARAVEAVSQFPPPTMVVLGNHDLPLVNSFRRLSAPYATFIASVTGDLDPVLDLGSVRIQGLASMPRWRWKSGRVSRRQADLIRSTFANSPSGTARVVALHHPPSMANLDSLAGRAEFERALVDAEVDVVLAGHTHVPAVRVLQMGRALASRQVIEVVAGTATSHRTRGIPRSWSLLEFTTATLAVTEHVADGPRWRPRPARELPLPLPRGTQAPSGGPG